MTTEPNIESSGSVEQTRSRWSVARAIIISNILVGASLAILIGYFFRTSIHDFMQADSDAAYFFEVASVGDFELHLDETLLLVENSLPIQIWTWSHRFFSALGFSADPLWGVLVNTGLVVASELLAILYARRHLPFDNRKLIGYSLLLAFNGLLMMFAGIHMRDAFMLFIATVAVLAFCPSGERWTMWIQVTKFFWLLVLMAAGFLIRREGFAVPLVIYAASIFVRVQAGSRAAKIGLFLMGAAMLVLLIWADLIGMVTSNYEAYKLLTQEESSESSLANYFIYGLPLPISIVASAVLLLFVKIPFWRGMFFDSYAFCISIAALQMLFVAPGILAILWYMLFNNIAASYKYLIYIVLALLLATSITSNQVRHFAVVYPFLLLLFLCRKRIILGRNAIFYSVFQPAAACVVALVGVLLALR